jgi:hypothetical protein
MLVHSSRTVGMDGYRVPSFVHVERIQQPVDAEKGFVPAASRGRYRFAGREEHLRGLLTAPCGAPCGLPIQHGDPQRRRRAFLRVRDIVGRFVFVRAIEVNFPGEQGRWRQEGGACE